MASQTATYFRIYDLEVFEGTLSAHVYPWHYHACYTIILVLKGAMKYVFREKEITIVGGEVLVINPFTSHYNTPIAECEYKAIFLPIDYVADIHNNRSIVQIQSETCNNQDLFRSLLDIVDDIKTLTDKKDCEKQETNIAQLLLRYLPSQTKAVSIDKRLIPAIEFIKANMDRKLAIEDIAKTCFLSHFHFQRLFKQNTGLTIHEYIQQQRTEHAKSLLRQGKKPTDTSFESGYFDQSHFHKAFKKMWVARPSQF